MADASLFVSQHEMILRMVAAGNYSLEEITEACGYSSCLSVTQFLRGKGIRPFPKTNIGMQRDMRDEKILNLRKAGCTHEEISHALQISSSAVAAVLRKRGEKGAVKKETPLFKSVCPICGKEFDAFVANKKYCSTKCEKAKSHRVNDIIRRTRKKTAIVDDDITLEKVAQKAGGRCALCGDLVDWDDVRFVNGRKYASKKYPSIDHIIPLAAGGTHSWDNVQLAHFSCNASKGKRCQT